MTIYNPGTCAVEIEKRFAPLVVEGKAIGREPDVVPAKPFAAITLQAGEATFDDQVALKEFGGVVGRAVLRSPRHRVGSPALGHRDPHGGRQGDRPVDHLAHDRGASRTVTPRP